jgi:hypothetical protein
MLSALTRNLPRKKPELWRNFPKPFIRHLLSRPRREVVADVGNNLRMKRDLRDGIASVLYPYGSYDPAVTEAIRSLLRSGNTFVDVGQTLVPIA